MTNTDQAICLHCAKTFSPDSSLMGDEGQCQDCWESEVSKSWWEMVYKLNNILQREERQ